MCTNLQISRLSKSRPLEKHSKTLHSTFKTSSNRSHPWKWAFPIIIISLLFDKTFRILSFALSKTLFTHWKLSHSNNNKIVTLKQIYRDCCDQITIHTLFTQFLRQRTCAIQRGAQHDTAFHPEVGSVQHALPQGHLLASRIHPVYRSSIEFTCSNENN